MTAKRPRRGKPMEAPPNPFEELLKASPHESRRCGARARSNGGEPCRKYAMIGRTRCRNHGGASTGRPTTTGQYTAEALRSRHFLQVVRETLRYFYDKPEPIEAPEGSFDAEALAQVYAEAQRAGRAALAAEAAYATAASGAPGSPASHAQHERITDGAQAACATEAPTTGPAATTNGGADQ